jgi:NitT/TauT family transport system permease protein
MPVISPEVQSGLRAFLLTGMPQAQRAVVARLLGFVFHVHLDLRREGPLGELRGVFCGCGATADACAGVIREVGRVRRGKMASGVERAWSPGTLSVRGKWVQRLRQHREKLLMPVVIAAGIGAWAGLVAWQEYPVFILPGPDVVWVKLQRMVGDGSLVRHLRATLSAILLGLALGLTTAFVLGYVLGKSRSVERLVAPYLVASQSVPIVAIAPLLVIWFGSGLLSKVLICALITFFPTLINTVVGVRGVDEDLRDLLRSLRANWWQTFRLLEWPAALPVIFGGLKLSVILAVVGAVVGEFAGADAGLGYLINLARGVLDTPMMFVAVILLVLIAQGLYLLVVLAESVLLRRQR